IDTIANANEPPAPFLAIVDGTTGTHLARAAIPNVRTKTNHTFRVALDAGNVSVYIDGINYINKFTIPGYTPFSGHWGFTGATGRSSRSDLPIDQESISRHHARISFDGQRHVIQDLGSTNGTFVNDVTVKTQPLKDGDQVKLGRSILKYMSGDNIEANYHEEIYRLMTMDALTQTHNRRYFNEALEREYNRSLRYRRALSLIIFDIDHFKQINDTYGH